jgi:aerobic-type carbon monoxide dehydrogenase small subunit (CoxS/CutS family)
MKFDISFSLNGSPVTATAEGSMRLVDLLRRVLGQTGTKEGCGEGECGACTVIVDGRAVNSCLFPALEIEGRSVTTIEGLAGQGMKLSVIQQAFVDRGAIQCGFCTPGMIMSAKALLDGNADPTEGEIREALIGNLCRCTGYVQIVEAVQEAAAKLKKKP